MFCSTRTRLARVRNKIKRENMNGNEIRNFRPLKFNEVVGRENQQKLERIQHQLLKGRVPDPLLIAGIYGYCKTSVARLILRSLDCRSRDPVTADPCGLCHDCQCFGKYYHGYGTPFRRFEYDCTTIGRPEIISIMQEHAFDDDVAVFLDEIHHLHEKFSQEPLLKFVEDFDGILLAAIMEDRLGELIPPLRERFDVLKLIPPSEEEIVDFFLRKTSEWKIIAPPELIRLLVLESGLSFRVCLRVLGAAADRDDRTLTKRLIQEMLGIDASTDDEGGVQ